MSASQQKSIWVGNERPSVLFDLATAWLLDKKVLLPGVTTLTRLSSVRERDAACIWQRLSSVVTPEQRTDLEGLLTRAGTSRITNHERLRRCAGYLVHPFPKKMVFTLECRRCDPSFPACPPSPIRRVDRCVPSSPAILTVWQRGQDPCLHHATSGVLPLQLPCL